VQERIAKEIQHGRFLAEHGAGQIWNWASPAGKLRWARRVKMLGGHLTLGMTVLELGCGTGYFTRELARSEADIVAIDVSRELLPIARENCSAPNIRYELQNACALTYSDGTFDSVVGSSVLHHLEIEQALREIHRVLKPGGTIHFTEPNMLNPQIAIQKNAPWIKRRLGDSPNETAFSDGRSIGCWNRPAIALFDGANVLGHFLERVPVISEFAGSPFIWAAKSRR
jgi:2-polyprenyl-3-methyl-5-hydroxy-6-metoxy-1,4-benzoquinol methylase